MILDIAYPIKLIATEAGYMLIVNKNQNYIRLSHASYILLDELINGTSLHDLPEKIYKGTGLTIANDDISELYKHTKKQIDKIVLKTGKKKSGFLLYLPVFSKKIVEKIASYLSIFYYSPICICFSGIIIATLLYFWFEIQTFQTSTNKEFFYAYFLFMISVLMHELGHASACRYYGARPEEIGFTIYVIFPYFCSNVNTAWGLNKKKE